jgi:lipoprotein-releasing system permease protein
MNKMFNSLPFYIGLRYIRAKRRNQFIAFISLVSMVGIALGVMVLITVLSVMNGFDREISERIFNMSQQVTISNLNQQVPNWQFLKDKVQNKPDVVGVAPFVAGQAMLANLGAARPVVITGILPNEERKVSQMAAKMTKGSFLSLKTGKFSIILGESMADNLGLEIGDKVTVLTTDVNVSPMGIMPQYKRFTLTGLFRVGGGFHIDDSIAFIDMHDAQKLFKLSNNVSGLRLKVTDLYVAPKVAQQLQTALPEFFIGDWTQEFGAYFKALQMEKSMMFIILLLIIAIAAFNLVSTLVMVVTDKRCEIAILRTLGASSRTIMGIFIVQGCVVGIIGTLLGIVSGILLAINAPSLVQGLQNFLHIQLISSSVYFIDSLPSQLQWKDVLQISVVSLSLSLVATIYPAWQASRTQPAEALRYE